VDEVSLGAVMRRGDPVLGRGLLVVGLELLGGLLVDAGRLERDDAGDAAGKGRRRLLRERAAEAVTGDDALASAAFMSAWTLATFDENW
jgi:hypothetical protein